MRIATVHDLPSGGARRAFRAFARELRAHGDTVDVFIPSSADETFMPSQEVADRLRVFPVVAWPSDTGGSPAGWLPLRALRYVRARKSGESAQQEIASVIDAGGYDVAFIHPSRLTQAPSVLAHLHRTASAYYCQEPLRAHYEHTSEPMNLPWRVAMEMPRVGTVAVDRRNVLAADRVLANSFFSRESILHAYGRDSTVVYCGVDTATFSPGPDPREGFVLSVGAIDTPKDHRLVVEAVATIPVARRPVVVIAGDRTVPSERAAIVAAGQRLGVDVRLHERLSEDALVDLYRTAGVVVCASRLEPFGLVPLEAGACAAPVVAVREGGLRESVVQGENGLLVDGREPAALGEAVDAVLSDPERAAELGRRGLELVRERWTWQRAGAALRDVLEDVVRTRSTPAPGS